PAVCLLVLIVGAHDHALNTGAQDRIGARRRVALVTAGLQRYVQGRAGEIDRSTGFDRGDLGVRPAVALVPTFAEDLPVARHDRADARVGLDLARPLLGQLDCACEVRSV